MSLPFPSHTPQQPRLDSCFRRNDRRKSRNDSFELSFAIFMPMPPLSSSTFPPSVILDAFLFLSSRFPPLLSSSLSPPSVILAFPPPLSSSTLVIEDPVSLSFPSHTPQQPKLDSCFRRNDRKRNPSPLSSSTFVIEDPVSLLFPSYMPQKSRLDSCFRRNDRKRAGMTEKGSRNDREGAGMTEKEQE